MRLLSKLLGKKKKHHHLTKPVPPVCDSHPQCKIEEDSNPGDCITCDCAESAKCEHSDCLNEECEDG